MEQNKGRTVFYAGRAYDFKTYAEVPHLAYSEYERGSVACSKCAFDTIGQACGDSDCEGGIYLEKSVQELIQELIQGVKMEESQEQKFTTAQIREAYQALENTNMFYDGFDLEKLVRYLEKPDYQLYIKLKKQFGNS